MNTTLPSAAADIGMSLQEWTLLKHLSRGLRMKEAAREMGLAPHTVKYNSKFLLARMRARNTPHAISLAKDAGII